MMAETPTELAEAYVAAIESRADDGEYMDAQEKLDGLQKRLTRFKDAYGNSDPATQELQEKVQTAEVEVEELERERREPEEFEHELLKAATGFLLDGEWLQPQVITSLNRALVGSPHSTLRVDEVELANPDDAENIEELTRYDIIDVVRKLALDKLGESDDLERTWQSIEGTTKEGPFRVVAESGKADPDDVKESLDEDIERKGARNRLTNAIYHLEINPYHREDGTYYLSTAGRYLATEYADAMAGEVAKSVEETSGDDGQTVLVGEAAPVKEGENDE